MNPSSERSEHVLWQSSSQEAREFAPQTPKVSANTYEDSVDFTTALLDKYEPSLNSSPPATWHPPTVRAELLPQPSHTQPGKRILSDFAGRFYRYSPGNLKGAPVMTSGSPCKRAKDLESRDILHPINEESLRDSVETLPGSAMEPPLPREGSLSTVNGILKLPLEAATVPSFSDSEEEEVIKHPDLEIHWKRTSFVRLVVYQVTRHESSITLWCRHDSGFCTVKLVKFWADTVVKDGDILHIVSPPGSNPPVISPNIIVDNSLVLVVNPDMLVPATTIAESFSCDRQALLRKRVRFPSSEISLPLVYGNIIHEAIQQCIINRDFCSQRLEEIFIMLLESYLEDLAVLNKPYNEALGELNEKTPEILKWAQNYVRDKAEFPINVYRQHSRNPKKFAILGSKYTELEIWSPQWGVLGKLDCIVQASTDSGVKLTGLEIKTGRAHSNSHRFQCSLYNLLMVDRFGSQATPWTVLYYSSTGESSATPTYPDETRGLIQQRNKLVRYLNDPFTLAPPVMGSLQTCKWCFVRSACSKYAASYQELDFLKNIDSDVVDQVKEDTRHLTGSHLEFIETWDTALTHEQQSVVTDVKSMWLQSPENREGSLNSIVNLRIKALKQCFSDGLTKKYLYELHRTSDFPTNSMLGENSAVYIGSFRSVMVTPGYIRSKGKNTLQVVTNHHITGESSLSITLNTSKQFTAYSRGNLLNLFDPTQAKLANLIVDLQAPRFKQIDYNFPNHFNTDQQNAILKVLGAEDYAIIRGMPGTGKTTTIVSLAQILAEKGKSVLITGYTNSSVDNIVLKLMRKNIDVLRLGNSPASIHDEVLKVAACTKEPHTREELENIYLKPKIIATTSLSLSSWVFNVRRFDYCIVDEASQLTLPASLGALQFAEKFVLVGDDFQLNPIVRNKQAKEAGLQVSLFEHLAKAHPKAVVNLSMQYRMNYDIMRLSSELVYDGLLKCATPEVAQKKLTLNKLSPFLKIKPWLDVNRSVVFVNTDKINANESVSPEGYYNAGEAHLVKEMVQAFIKNGLNPNEVGVISEYKRQVQTLKEEISPLQPNVEVLTADKAQGRDKECIIISLVRSNNEGNVGTLLRDWRRINVVFTRARCKLVIIGSRKTLKSASALERFIKLIESHNWIWDAT